MKSLISRCACFPSAATRPAVWCFLAIILMLVPETHAQTIPSGNDQNAAVQTQMRNVIYHFTESAAVHIKSLDGELLPAKPAEFPVFDNKDSFRLRIGSAEISIAARDLADVFNSYVFARPNTPLSGLSVSIQNGRLKIKGRLHEVGAIPFETNGFLSPTSDGKILLRAQEVKALHVPVKGLMNLFGVEVADLIKNGKIPGVQSSGDDLILDPSLIFPPPHMDGKVTAMRFDGDTVVLTFGDKKHAPRNLQPGNYMSYRGNRLGFGKLTMTDTDIILIDMDPKDPFDFYLDRYKAQLSAGYTKITSSFGLRVFVKDFNKLDKTAVSAKQKKSADTQN